METWSSMTRTTRQLLGRLISLARSEFNHSSWISQIPAAYGQVVSPAEGRCTRQCTWGAVCVNCNLICEAPTHDHRREQAGNHDPEPAKDTIPLPQTPKRRRADENDPPHRATKRSRRSAGATPAPTRTTRSAAKKAATDQRELDGIAEEEEEQVLSLLTHISDRE